MMTETKSESWEKEFDEKFKCIQSGCDGNGCIPVAKTVGRQVSETEFVEDVEWEAEQCQFCYEYRFPIKSFISSQRQKDRERFMRMLEQMKKDEEVVFEDKTMEFGKGRVSDYRYGYNQCLSDLEQVIISYYK